MGELKQLKNMLATYDGMEWNWYNTNMNSVDRSHTLACAVVFNENSASDCLVETE